MRTTLIAAAAALAFGITGAQAATYTWGFDTPTVGGDTTAGSYDELRITFTKAEEGIVSAPTLSLSGTVAMNESVGTINGGWFALTPGGDPREADDQIAIFYMDFASGLVSAYRYDGTLGVNGTKSFTNQDLFITAFENAVTTSITDGKISFSIADLDLTDVQSASDSDGYTGAAFGEEIGLWLHLAVLREFEADDLGRVTAFSDAALASFDLPRGATDNLDAVPLPGAAIFALTGLAGLAGFRRVKRSA